MRKAIAILAIVLCSIGAKGQSVSDTSGIRFTTGGRFITGPPMVQSTFWATNKHYSDLLYKEIRLSDFMPDSTIKICTCDCPEGLKLKGQ